MNYLIIALLWLFAASHWLHQAITTQEYKDSVFTVCALGCAMIHFVLFERERTAK